MIFGRYLYFLDPSVYTSHKNIEIVERIIKLFIVYVMVIALFFLSLSMYITYQLSTFNIKINKNL